MRKFPFPRTHGPDYDLRVRSIIILFHYIVIRLLHLHVDSCIAVVGNYSKNIVIGPSMRKMK